MTEIFLFIDALGWRIAGEHHFLLAELPCRQALEMQFGYSCAAIPTLLSGQKPAVHGHLSLFRFAPEASPFRTIARLASLFKPDWLWSRGRVRNQLSKWLKRHHGFTGYFQIYNLPFRKLGMMDYCEKQNLFVRNGMAPSENLCDLLEASGLPYHISDWHLRDEENFRAGMDAIRGGAKFLFLYAAELDAVLHRHVRHPEAIAEKLRWYEGQVRALMAFARSHCGDFRLTVVSDHGMTAFSHAVNPAAAIDATGLRFGEDYGACFDSTMARFYYLKPNAEKLIRQAMRRFDGDGHFLSREEESRYGILREDRLFGDAIFLVRPGVQIVPSDMASKPLDGMHGYAPDDGDSVASLLSTAPLPGDVRQLADVFGLMKARAGRLAASPGGGT